MLSSRDDFELEILLHPASCFFNRDYDVFDCGGVALSEAALKRRLLVRIELLSPVATLRERASERALWPPGFRVSKAGALRYWPPYAD
jgi:hypothetical protein